VRVRDRLSPAELTFNPEEVLLRASALFRTEQWDDLQGLIAEKIEHFQDYDVLQMDRVVAILMWGRSGSLLLSSYLDGHDEVLMLPETWSQRLYEFFERYRRLPLCDKLIGYAAYEPDYPVFFKGDFAIQPAQYYAAVQAILECCRPWPAEFLESRRAFFLFVHIAYNLALGRRLATRTPVIVYAQHQRDNEVAKHVIQDFPRAKFVHTIRDPISSCDGLFQYHFKFVETHTPAHGFLPTLPYMALSCLTGQDRPHDGMEARTRTVRFEDLHSDTPETMRDLCDWLGLPHRPTLVDSTFNGIPYVVKRDGKAWTGRRLEQLQRHSWNLSRKDQALLFALFYENFVEWDYPCPKIFAIPLVRYIVFLALFLVPTNMEMLAARAVFKRRILPAVKDGNILEVIESLLGIALCRLKIILRLAPAFFRRCVSGAILLQVDEKRRARGPREDGARAATNETTLT
jgi:hypothetical protein